MTSANHNVWADSRGTVIDRLTGALFVAGRLFLYLVQLSDGPVGHCECFENIRNQWLREKSACDMLICNQTLQKAGS
jgi:hypothetical protein